MKFHRKIRRERGLAPKFYPVGKFSQKTNGQEANFQPQIEKTRLACAEQSCI